MISVDDVGLREEALGDDGVEVALQPFVVTGLAGDVEVVGLRDELPNLGVGLIPLLLRWPLIGLAERLRRSSAPGASP